MIKKISVILPTYNERENIEELINRIFSISKKNRLNLEVVVVDDGSRDGTPEVVMSLSKNYKVKLLERTRKMGLTSAIMDGLKLAKGNIIGVMDADLSHRPEDIPKLVKAIEDNDIVIGSKYTKGGKVKGVSTSKIIISYSATLAAKILFDIKVKDPMSGFFFCKRDIIEKTKINAKGFKILLNVLVENRNKKIKEVPIVFVERKRGKSKLSFQEIINYIITVSRLRVNC